MKTAPSLPCPQAFRAILAGILLLLVFTPGPSSAQTPIPPPTSQTPPPALPDGVRQVYALQGTNQILAIATPEGYDRLLDLVRNLDGDLDIHRTKVVSVEVRTSDLMALGVTTGPDAVSLSAADDTKLLAALQSGKLRTVETLRITTRENTAVTTLLRRAGARNPDGGTPFTLIPREGKSGALTLEIHEPVAAQVSVQSGQTAVISLPGLTTDTTRLLFLTPTVLPSESRPPR